MADADRFSSMMVLVLSRTDSFDCQQCSNSSNMMSVLVDLDIVHVNCNLPDISVDRKSVV